MNRNNALPVRIVHIISSLEVGGAQKILFDVINGLPEFDHAVIYFRHGPFYERFRERGVPAFAVKGFMSLYDPIFFIRLYRLIKRLDPVFIHCVLWAAGTCGSIIARWLRKSCVISLHNNLVLNGRLRWFIDRIVKAGTSGSFIAVSDEVAQSARGYYAFLNIDPVILVIENGIDIKSITNQHVQKRITRKDLGADAHHILIGSVGRLDSVKNYPLLIESFALLNKYYSNARLIIVGSGLLENILREQIDAAGLKDKIYLLVNKNASDFYHLFDLFVQTSITEGISLALLEAMSFRLPCIAMGKRHSVIMHDVNGLLVEHIDPVALCDRYCMLIKDDNLSRRLGSCAYKTVFEQYTMAVMLARYRDAFIKFSK